MSVLEKFKSIRTFVFDVDGVMTDGSVQIFETGEQVRRMNTRDGYSLQLAVRKGYHVVVISGGNSEGVRRRLQYLGIKDIFLDVHDKVALLVRYAKDHGLDEKDMLYMGDDIPDYAAMQHVGLACAPSDAAPEIRHIAAYISSFGGGQGCVRDVVEKVLKLNGQWDLDQSVASK
ncbi:MAG TPA: HAD hydrolase family protein [Puia sp.]|uniref:KdsC family phosphatase n=1 Tax=Puia sp. TaxID=2045100 RepID=UPI002BEFED1A|nr:HAD hydrolase family protein [Puia sp.]HVU96202.1 HAD hydrolase family protein [Puia sp.]